MDPASLQTPASRIEYILRLMLSGEWLASSKWFQTLSGKWGVEISTVRKYARDAATFLEIDREEINHLRRVLANKYLAIADDALNERNVVTGLKDYGSALKALDRYAKYSGIDAVVDAPQLPQQQTVRVIFSDGHQAESPSVDSPKANS